MTRFFQGLYYDNLGITYSSGIFTIHGANGDTLSTINPAIVVLPSIAAPGQFIKYQVTANIVWDDSAGTSDIVGNTFGNTAGDDWGAFDLPFFIYVAPNDAESAVAFFISRSPAQSSLSATLGDPSAANADTQGAHWCMTDITEANYASNVAFMIGSIRMRTSQPNDDWTVQALTATEGFGRFQERSTFTFPVALFGASSGTHLLANSGTAPTFTSSVYQYSFTSPSQLTIDLKMSGNSATDGAGSVTAQMALPFKVSSTHVTEGGSFHILNGTLDHGFLAQEVASQNYTQFVDVTDGTVAQNADFTDAAREINGRLTFFLESP